MDSSKNYSNQGTFTDKPLTTPGGRQEAINKVKESWNENVADPAQRSMDKAKHSMDENSKSGASRQGEGWFTDKPLTTPAGRQEAVNKVKESWNENISDPAKRNTDKMEHRADENKEQAKYHTGQEKGVLQDLKDKTNENIVEPMQRGFEKAKEKISETFSSDTNKTGSTYNNSTGVENKPLTGSTQASH